MLTKELLMRVSRDWCHPIDCFSARQLEAWVQDEIAKDSELKSVRNYVWRMNSTQLFAISNAAASSGDWFRLACVLLEIFNLEQTAPEERIGLTFTRYANYSGNSSAVAYQTGEAYIAVVFTGPANTYYVYNYRNAGLRAVERLKMCAAQGTGLAAMTHPKYFRQGKNCSLVFSRVPLKIVR